MPVERDPEEVESRTLHAYADLAAARVLEIGCGEGRLIERYAPVAAWVVGLDYDPLRLAGAAQVYPPAGQERVRLVRAQAETLPFPDARFDRTILAWSL
jgi:ubiquinone/menaquinone biosynthesis C-methylase UbiE